MEVLVDVLLGQAPAPGRLPVKVAGVASDGLLTCSCRAERTDIRSTSRPEYRAVWTG